ncbi:MAG: acylphosphatase [Candidatus Melainabacteria bacterium]|nr:acylphosphatase [Candidatus Melainabacteria bacterium]
MAILSRAQLTVSGRVQGVFYRQTTCQKARSLGLTGWVRNADDGSVEIEVAGNRPLIEEFIAWCRIGPPSASVSQIDITWLEKDTNYQHTGFEIVS